MSAATFHPELKSTTRKDGTRAVRIRITKFRQHAYWNLGKYVQPSQWNPKPSLKLHNYIIKHDNAAQINNAIKNALTNLDQVADTFPAATAAGIKDAYEKALRPEAEQQTIYRNFFEFADEITQRRREITYGTGESFHYMLQAFKEIAGANTAIEELVSPRVLHKYIQALKTKGNSPVTINVKLKDLGSIYNAGVKEKAFPNLGTPFADARLKQPKKKLERPTADQVKAFVNYQPENELQAKAKTVTMLQYLLHGARITEALTLQWANVQDNYVEYLPQKGAKKPKFVPRSNMLNKLLDTLDKTGRYVLPYIGEDYPTLPLRRQYNRKKRQREQVNEGLKEIAEKLGIPKLKSHMFRHAFADAIIASGSNIHVAATLLGHSNPRTTEGYVRDLQIDEVSNVSLSIFDKLEGERGEQ